MCYMSVFEERSKCKYTYAAFVRLKLLMRSLQVHHRDTFYNIIVSLVFFRHSEVL